VVRTDPRREASCGNFRSGNPKLPPHQGRLVRKRHSAHSDPGLVRGHAVDQCFQQADQICATKFGVGPAYRSENVDKKSLFCDLTA